MIWGLGIGDWAPIPNPQLNIKNLLNLLKNNLIFKKLIIILIK